MKYDSCVSTYVYNSTYLFAKKWDTYNQILDIYQLQAIHLFIIRIDKVRNTKIPREIVIIGLKT